MPITAQHLPRCYRDGKQQRYKMSDSCATDWSQISSVQQSLHLRSSYCPAMLATSQFFFSQAEASSGQRLQSQLHPKVVPSNEPWKNPVMVSGPYVHQISNTAFPFSVPLGAAITMRWFCSSTDALYTSCITTTLGKVNEGSLSAEFLLSSPGETFSQATSPGRYQHLRLHLERITKI